MAGAPERGMFRKDPGREFAPAMGGTLFLLHLRAPGTAEIQANGGSRPGENTC